MFSMTSLILGVVGVLGLGIIALILTKLYKRATKEVVFIRTGFGGEKVIMDGGALVFPILHETQDINMTTLKLIVSRKNEQALITKDRLRVDINAEFYLRVKSTKEAISMAAQTLGAKTLNESDLLTLMEGKLVDVLRSTAAGMNMSELHEKRSDFVQEVQKSVAEDLIKNGLELEAISLTGLDQTDIQYFNEQNVFDAEGLKKIVEQTELRRKERNDIQQSTKLEIEQKNLEVEKESLKIKQEEEEAKIIQETNIKNKKAEQEAEVIKVSEEKRKEAELVSIKTAKEIEQERITKEKTIKESEIKISKELAILEQDKQIAISNKAQEEIKAKAEENLAKAKEIESEEKVATAREVEIANRDKELALIEANKTKEALIVEAKGKAESILAIAEAKEKEYKIDAEGKKILIEAENFVSKEILEFKAKEILLKALPSIVAEMVKPMENIDSIKIIDAQGFIGNGSNGKVSSGEVNTSFPDQVVNASLKHKAFVPFMDNILKDLNLDVKLNSNNLNGIVEGFIGNTKTNSFEEVEAPIKTNKEEDYV